MMGGGRGLSMLLGRGEEVVYGGSEVGLVSDVVVS